MAILSLPELPDGLREAAGTALVTDPTSLDLYSHDVFASGKRPLAALRPTSVEQLAEAVAAATAAGLAIVPRGGGMSYTQGYLCERDALLIDTASLDRIIEVNESDLTATVEAGVTWEQLHRRLQPLGLRARVWGTLSGLRATVGGGMSQNGLFWGARDGSAVDAALSFDVVLADGTILTTGKPFFRPYGPDLTGLFAGDCGALGVKARVTLRLVRDGPAFGYASFAFDHAQDFLGALSAIARAGLAAESFGFDPFLQAQRMKRDSLASDARSLMRMMKAQGSLRRALKEGAKVVAAGRSFLNDAAFSLHCISENRHEAGAAADVAAMVRLAREAGGREVENSIPKILRANPFPPPNSMVGPDGERWVPVHAFLPHSRLADCWAAVQSLYRTHETEMRARKVEAGAMFAAASGNAALIEPVFFWPDALNPLHAHAVEPQHLARLKGFPADEPARALVVHLRSELIALFERMGAVHLQIARTYPLAASHDPAGWSLLTAVKQQLDPRGLMNPGSLGL